MQFAWVVAHVARCRSCAEKLEAERFARRFGATMGGVAEPDIGTLESQPVVPGYEIHREIARGGQGVVYEAEQSATGQRVAIKVLHTQASSSGGTRAARARFQREIQIAGTLAHPGIVRPVDSLCLADGRDALILELVEGESLGDWVSMGRDGAEVLSIMAQVADALEHAHQRGVIHRDLKPSNVLVDSSGRARVLDFGVARRRSAGGDVSLDRVTMTGEFTGTLAYAAPEQVSQSYAGPDVRSDVYALGVMGYEALTGMLPYAVDGSLETVIRNILSAEAPSASEARLDRDTWTVLAKAMAKEPERRYQSAGELARDLRRAAAGEAIEARRDSRWYVIRKGLERHRLAVSVLGAAVFGLVSVAVALAVGNARLSQALHVSTLRQLHAHIQSDARARAEEILWPMIERSGIRTSEDAASALWSGDLSRLEALWAFVEMQSRAECRRVVRMPTQEPSTVGALKDGSYGVLRAGGRVTTFQDGAFTEGAALPAGARAAWFLPGGRWIVSNTEEALLCVDAETGAIVGRTPGKLAPTDIGGMAFADWGICVSLAGGKLVVYGLPEFEVLWQATGIASGQTVWLDPEDRLCVWLDEPGLLVLTDIEHPERSRRISLNERPEGWGASAGQVLVDRQRQRAVVLQATGAVIRDISSDDAVTSYHTWVAARITGAINPEGTLLATREFGSPNARIWRADTVEQVAVLPGHATAASDLCFSLDGSRILTTDRLGVFREWATPGSGWSVSLGEATSRGLDIAVSEGGNHVIAANAEGRLVRYESANGGSEWVGPDVGFPVSKVAISEQLGLASLMGDDECLVICSLDGQEELARWSGDGSWLASARFSPNGETLAACTRAGNVVLLDPADGTELHRRAVGNGAMASAVRWSPDGAYLAVGSRDGSVTVLDGKTLGVIRAVKVFPTQMRGIEWAADGRSVWAVADEGVVVLIDAASGRVRSSERISEHSLFAIAPHPEGRVLLVGDRAGVVHALDAQSLQVLAGLDAERAVLAMEFDAKGSVLFVSALDRPVRRWDLGSLAATLPDVRP